MSYSFNEIEATAKKAARGIGYSWGLAQDAGKAVRWLCQQNVDGCAALARLLANLDGNDVSTFAPRVQPNLWVSDNGTMCPVIAGATLSDYAISLQANGLQLQHVQEPTLLYFFAAQVALQRGTTVILTWSGVKAATDGERMSVTGLNTAGASHVTITFGIGLGALNVVRARVEPNAHAWFTLNQFAHRTYAPSTDESRRTGAGAADSS